MYHKGDMRKYQLKIKRMVAEGKISKEEAIIMILGRAQQWLLQAAVTPEQFMLDRKGEAYDYN